MAERVDRLTRVNSLIRKEVAMLIEHLTLPEPGMLVSVTEVHSSVDLRNSTILVSIFGGSPEGREATMALLRKSRTHFQSELARNLAFKHTPVLSFKCDNRIADGDRVLQILNEVEKPEPGELDK